MKDYPSYSLWLSQVGDLSPRPVLRRDLEVDVAIVGGGYTGLWTAYYLKKADPGLRIALLERDVCGFGASGRNGGWCSALFAASKKKIARRHGRAAAVAMQKAMFDTVDEVGRVTAAERIDCDFHKGGTLTLAPSPAHVGRVREEIVEEHSWGFSDRDFSWLDEAEVRQRIHTPELYGAAFTPHCAALHPAKLARGLADVVEGLGVEIYEQTAAATVEPHLVETDAGRTVRARFTVLATEAFTVELAHAARRLVPLYSLMIATESLGEAFWDEVGWRDRETITDGHHLLIYAQRTADDRIAFGGRGAPYHFGSRISDDFDRDPHVFIELKRVLHSLFPAVRHAAITHHWGGPVGVPRDWYSSVSLDADGMAWAGGYVGDGVSTSNLAGRTLRDLILGHDTAITRLPWVGHRSRRWEPEPLRWIGTNLALRAMGSADHKERKTRRATRRGDLLKKIVGI
ncbi:MAG: FAD-dependent oxidoreductase [Actinobacteria bacterium]|nr:FAD-dependent oxidoreductase [Actinomycetota bacterium]